MSEAVQSFEIQFPQNMIFLHFTTEELHIITEFKKYKNLTEKCYIKKVEFEKQVIDVADPEITEKYQNICNEFERSILRYHSLIPKYSEIQAKVFNFFKNPWYSLEAHIRFIHFCYDINFNNQEIIKLNLELNTVISKIHSLNSQDIEFSKKFSSLNSQKDQLKIKLDECLDKKIKYEKIYQNHVKNLRDFRLDL